MNKVELASMNKVELASIQSGNFVVRTEDLHTLENPCVQNV